MEGSLSQCVDRYCELAKIQRGFLRSVVAPPVDDRQIEGEAFQEQGRLHGDAVEVLMEVLCAARLLGFGLLHSISRVAREVTHHMGQG
jgi:hypothetical protein